MRRFVVENSLSLFFVLILVLALVGQSFAGSGRVIGATLLVGVVVAIGSMLLYLPGLILAVLTIFVVPAAARGARVSDAFGESVRLVKDNLGTAVVAYLVVMAISSIGGMFIITAPISIALSAFFAIGMYERLSRRELPAVQGAA